MVYHCDLLRPLIDVSPHQRVLIHPDGKELTSGKLFHQSRVVAYNLYQQGFRENDMAVITAPGGESFLIIVYALILLRGRVALIDPEMGRIHFDAKLKQLNPKWAFVDSRLLLLNEHPIARSIAFYLNKNIPYFKAPAGCKVISVGAYMPTVKKHLRFRSLLQANGIVLPELTPTTNDHEFIVVYTSGTVQAPKGVVHTFSSLTLSINHLKEIIGWAPHDLIATDLPQYMLIGISAGIPIMLFPSLKKTPTRLAWLEKHQITILFSPPSELLPLVEYCEKHAQPMPPTLRKILLGSAPVHKKFLKRLMTVLPSHTSITCMYGMTELLVCAVIDGAVKANYVAHGDVLGKPWKDVTCTVADDGEILLRSPQLFSGYFQQEPQAGFHATGDVGYMDDAGYLVLTGRKKDMIIRRSFNIYPVIYETIVRMIEGIKDCAMVGIWNDRKNDEDVYLIVEGSGITPTEIKKAITTGKYALDHQALPDYILLGNLPRSGRQHKVDKKLLVAEITKGKLSD